VQNSWRAFVIATLLKRSLENIIQVKIKILNFSNVIFSEELRYITILNFFFGSPKNRQVTHLYYVLSQFLRESVSERIERIERGAMIKKNFFMKNPNGILEI
jgi:hypothetical protein